MKRKKLIARRKALKMSLSDMAKNTGFDRSYFSMIENGTRTPSADAWKKIFKALKINESDMGGYLIEPIN